MSKVKQEGKLFVYGTLKKGEQRFRSIEDYVTNIEKVKLPGFTLYDLGAFPAIICTHSMDDIVIGELVTVNDIEKVLAICDRIEGYKEDRKYGNLYNRIEVEVQTLDGYWMGEASTYEFANFKQLIVNYSGRQAVQWCRRSKEVVDEEV